MRRLWGDSNNEFLNKSIVYMGLPGCLSGKESVCQAGDMCLIPGLGRSPGGGNGKSLQDSCLGNPMNRGAWRATVYGVSKCWMKLSTYTRWNGQLSHLLQRKMSETQSTYRQLSNRGLWARQLFPSNTMSNALKKAQNSCLILNWLTPESYTTWITRSSDTKQT